MKPVGLKMLRVLVLFLGVSLLLTACADFPDLDRAISHDAKNGDYPLLVEIDPLPGGDPGDFTRAEEIAKAISARARALLQRAKMLRGPVIERRSRARLTRAFRRHKRLRAL